MTLQTSGAISLNDIQNEFGGSSPISLSEYYADASDPFIGTIPTSGAISLSNFYAGNRRTARMGRPGSAVSNQTNNGGSLYTNTRIGWSLANGSEFYYYEAGSQTNAFGSITRYTGLSTVAQLGGIWVVNYYYPSFNYSRKAFSISHRSSSNSGWTRVEIRGPTYPSGGVTTIDMFRTWFYFKRQTGNTEQRNYYQWSTFSDNSYGGATGRARVSALFDMFLYCQLNNRSIYLRFS